MPPKTVDLGGLIFLWTQCFFTSIISYYLVRELKNRFYEKKMLEDIKASNQYLAETNIKFQNLAAQAELITAIKERTRIAREIHDALAYTITNLLALLNALREKIKATGEEVPVELEQARILARDGLGDVRQVLRTLRPGDGEGYIGLGSINRLVKVFGQATGIDVSLNFADVPQFLGEPFESVIYRIVQEGLTNAFRHGKATEILVSFCYHKEAVEVMVKDNGIGTDEPSGGFGLIGIKERVAELGGSVMISSQPGCGFELLARLPLQKEFMRDGTFADNDCR
ncbi:MAG: sensor histidine kinase [Bacillota bacterium]